MFSAAPLLLIQTLAEYGLLESLVAGFTSVSYRIESYIGTGNTPYLLIGLILVLGFLLTRRRR